MEDLFQLEPVEQVGESFLGTHTEVILDESVVVWVELDQVDRRLEAAGSDRTDHRPESGFGSSRLPTSHDGLRRAQASSQLRLREALPKACLSDQRATLHQQKHST